MTAGAHQRPAPREYGRLLAVAGLVVSALLVTTWTSCSTSEPRPDRVPKPLPVADSQESEASAGSGEASPGDSVSGLEVVTWGGDGTVLALVVRNATARTVLRAQVLITALDRRGRRIGAVLGTPEESTCCAIFGLPPGAEFGLFAELDQPVSKVAEVRVRYASVKRVSARGPRPRIEVTDVELHRVPGDAEVTASLRAHGRVGLQVAGQAFLVDRDDRLVAVISGRFFCFSDGVRDRVRMELLRPVPSGTRVSAAVAYPIPDPSPVHVTNSCR